MSIIRRITKCTTKKVKNVYKNQLLIPQTLENVHFQSIQNEGLEYTSLRSYVYKLSDDISQFLTNESGFRIQALQSKSQGFSGFSKKDNHDFAKIEEEHFGHTLQREDPQDFRLADLEEVQSIVMLEKPTASKNSTMDKELVQFFGFVTKKLNENTKGLQTAI
jgi:hypothetical protein